MIVSAPETVYRIITLWFLALLSFWAVRAICPMLSTSIRAAKRTILSRLFQGARQIGETSTGLLSSVAMAQ